MPARCGCASRTAAPLCQPSSRASGYLAASSAAAGPSPTKVGVRPTRRAASANRSGPFSAEMRPTKITSPAVRELLRPQVGHVDRIGHEMHATGGRQALADHIDLKSRDGDVIGKDVRQVRDIARQRQTRIAPEFARVIARVAMASPSTRPTAAPMGRCGRAGNCRNRRWGRTENIRGSCRGRAAPSARSERRWRARAPWPSRGHERWSAPAADS